MGNTVERMLERNQGGISGMKTQRWCKGSTLSERGYNALVTRDVQRNKSKFG
jgi:hypothetical protein